MTILRHIWAAAGVAATLLADAAHPPAVVTGWTPTPHDYEEQD